MNFLPRNYLLTTVTIRKLWAIYSQLNKKVSYVVQFSTQIKLKNISTGEKTYMELHLDIWVLAINTQGKYFFKILPQWIQKLVLISMSLIHNKGYALVNVFVCMFTHICYIM